MKMEIIKILDRGVLKDERLWLKVLNDTDLSFYIVLHTNYITLSSISSYHKHSFWFPPKKVKSGDYIIFYTRAGSPAESKNADGSTNYFIYWGLSNSVYNTNEDCAVLFEINTWKTTPLEQK